MPRWHARRPWVLCGSTRVGVWRRTFASGSNPLHYEQVPVRCGSSGHINLDLHNVLYHPKTAPLIIYLPPFCRPPNFSPPLPSFTKRFPTVVINYRWPEDSLLSDPVPADPMSTDQQPHSQDLVPTNPLHWPTPIHDCLFGYSWIIANLIPQDHQRRDIYVVGSYLGASLAASLALTESHTHERMAVRGLALYNGIYDWTTFLPEQHTKPAATQDALAAMKSLLEHAHDNDKDDGDAAQGGSAMHYLRQLVPTLFKAPTNLFDPFASPALFFRSTGLLVPPSFEPSASTLPPAFERAVAELSLDEASTPAQGSPEAARLEVAYSAPRRGYSVFPPRQSTLRIPDTLVLHETAAGRWVDDGRRQRRRGAKVKTTTGRNDFESQAMEMARLMQRSVKMYEMRERMKLDEDVDFFGDEAERRIQLRDIGTEDAAAEAFGLVVGEWLEQTMEASQEASQEVVEQ